MTTFASSPAGAFVESPAHARDVNSILLIILIASSRVVYVDHYNSDGSGDVPVWEHTGTRITEDTPYNSTTLFDVDMPLLDAAIDNSLFRWRVELWQPRVGRLVEVYTPPLFGFGAGVDVLRGIDSFDWLRPPSWADEPWPDYITLREIPLSPLCRHRIGIRDNVVSIERVIDGLPEQFGRSILYIDSDAEGDKWFNWANHVRWCHSASLSATWDAAIDDSTSEKSLMYVQREWSGWFERIFLVDNLFNRQRAPVTSLKERARQAGRRLRVDTFRYGRWARQAANVISGLG